MNKKHIKRWGGVFLNNTKPPLTLLIQKDDNVDNTDNKLNLTSLSNAIASFQRALDEYEKDNTNEFVRDACIQRFEYCYDLSAKYIKRHLSLISENPEEIKEISFQEVIRRAYTVGIIEHSWDQWWKYRDNRAATSRSYNEERAKEVVSGLLVFNNEVNFLLTQLKKSHET